MSSNRIAHSLGRTYAPSIELYVGLREKMSCDSAMIEKVRMLRMLESEVGIEKFMYRSMTGGSVISACVR